MIRAINTTQQSISGYRIKNAQKRNLQSSKTEVNFGISDNAKCAGGMTLSLLFAAVGSIVAACGFEDVVRAGALGGGWILAIATGFITTHRFA